MPESVFITDCCDDFVYSCFEIEALRMVLPGYLARMEEEDRVSPANTAAGVAGR